MVQVSVGEFVVKLVAQYAIRSPIIISIKEREVDGHSFQPP